MKPELIRWPLLYFKTHFKFLNLLKKENLFYNLVHPNSGCDHWTPDDFLWHTAHKNHSKTYSSTCDVYCSSTACSNVSNNVWAFTLPLYFTLLLTYFVNLKTFYFTLTSEPQFKRDTCASGADPWCMPWKPRGKSRLLWTISKNTRPIK